MNDVVPEGVHFLMIGPSATVLQKLTLVVLVGILGCLIVIIAQNWRSSQTAEVQANEEVAAPEVSAEAEPVVTETPVRRPAQASAPTRATNRVVSPVRARPQAARGVAAAERPSGADANAVTTVDPPAEPVVYSTVLPVVASAPPNGTVITGRVTLIGTPPPEIPIDPGPVCGRLHPEAATTRHYVVSAEGGLANVLVYVQEGVGTGSILVEGEPPLLDNVGCFFEPYVMAIRAGQTLRIRNSDPTFHNVHVTPRNSSEFNFAMPVQNQLVERRFSKPELFIRVKCDVHPWMFAYVNVLEHSFFAITESAGNFRLPPLAHGTYLVTAQHPKNGFVRQRISVTGTGEQVLNFSMKAPAPQVSQR